MSQPLWGIDLGGTKIEGVILPSLNNPQPIIRTRIDTEGHKGYEHVIGQIGRLVQRMKEESGLTPARIGFGTPGVLDPILQTMKNSNSTSLNGRYLKKDLEAALQLPAVLANDANCFALAETHWGVVKEKVPDAQVVFGIIMGTGVGGGIVLNGNVWNGKHGIAGEWGHNFLDESGGRCYCGKTGCVETVISGPALQRFYKGQSGKDKTLKEIAATYNTLLNAALDANPYDPFVTGPEEATIHRLIYFAGKAISVVVNSLDPDAIVIGGGVGNIEALYDIGKTSLPEFIFNNRVDVPILKPKLGDSAGVFGAAALVA